MFAVLCVDLECIINQNEHFNIISDWLDISNPFKQILSQHIKRKSITDLTKSHNVIPHDLEQPVYTILLKDGIHGCHVKKS